MDIVTAISSLNPWWRTSKVPEVKLKEFMRRDFYTLPKIFDTDKISCIVGARRVGKTTLLFQLMDYLMKERKISPKRILYLSMDNFYLSATLRDSKIPLMEILDTYSKYVLLEPLDDLKSEIYVFLDEIHFLPDWTSNLKTWFDLGYKIKFVVSGSSTLNIREAGSKLIGRMLQRVILPMKFVDIINYNKFVDKKERQANYRGLDLRNYLDVAITQENPDVFFNGLVNTSKLLAGEQNEIIGLLQRYLIQGGLPEVLGKDYSESSEILGSYSRDYMSYVCELFKIRDLRSIQDMLVYVAEHTSDRFNVFKISNMLSLSPNTVKYYLDVLEKIFLISRSGFYSKGKSTPRKEKKIYVTDVGFRNAIISRVDQNLLTDLNHISKILEGVIYDHSLRLKCHFEKTFIPNLYYWRNQTYEVDIIFDPFSKPIPIEVKYSDSIDNKDLRGIKSFFEHHKSPFGIVITKEKLGREDNILLVPSWLFLIMC